MTAVWRSRARERKPSNAFQAFSPPEPRPTPRSCCQLLCGPGFVLGRDYQQREPLIVQLRPSHTGVLIAAPPTAAWPAASGVLAGQPQAPARADSFRYKLLKYFLMSRNSAGGMQTFPDSRYVAGIHEAKVCLHSSGFVAETGCGAFDLSSRSMLYYLICQRDFPYIGFYVDRKKNYWFRSFDSPKDKVCVSHVAAILVSGFLLYVLWKCAFL